MTLLYLALPQAHAAIAPRTVKQLCASLLEAATPFVPRYHWDTMARDQELLATITQVEQQIIQHLGYRPSVEIERIDDYMVLKARDWMLRPIGTGILYLRSDADTLHVTNFEIRLKKSGISTYLLAQMLRLKPDVRKIYAGNMSKDNYDVIQKALAGGMSLQRALRQSPAFRARARLGFIDLELLSYSGASYSFIAVRPEQ